jgi:hypothetical protein
MVIFLKNLKWQYGGSVNIFLNLKI